MPQHVALEHSLTAFASLSNALPNPQFQPTPNGAAELIRYASGFSPNSRTHSQRRAYSPCQDSTPYSLA